MNIRGVLKTIGKATNWSCDQHTLAGIEIATLIQIGFHTIFSSLNILDRYQF